MSGRKEGQRVGPYAREHRQFVNGGTRQWPYAERVALGLTIDELAEFASVSRRTIIRYERGAPGQQYHVKRCIEDGLRRGARSEWRWEIVRSGSSSGVKK